MQQRMENSAKFQQKPVDASKASKRKSCWIIHNLRQNTEKHREIHRNIRYLAKHGKSEEIREKREVFPANFGDSVDLGEFSGKFCFAGDGWDVHEGNYRIVSTLTEPTARIDSFGCFMWSFASVLQELCIEV